jgi:hypothetical protein
VASHGFQLPSLPFFLARLDAPRTGGHLTTIGEGRT